MGMPVTIEVIDPSATSRTLSEAMIEFRDLDDLFSPFKPDSAVSRINRGELAPEDAGETVGQAIRLCEMFSAATDGYFSAWIGGRFDPSGLVKAWAIDRACSHLERCRFLKFLRRCRRGRSDPRRQPERHPVARGDTPSGDPRQGLESGTRH